MCFYSLGNSGTMLEDVPAFGCSGSGAHMFTNSFYLFIHFYENTWLYLEVECYIVTLAIIIYVPL